MNTVYKIEVLIIIYIINFILIYNAHLNGHKYYNDRIINNKITPKIYDIGMTYIPDLSENKFLTFIIDVIPITLPIIILNDNTYYTFVKLIIYSLILRSIFINLTILPKIKKCDDSNISIYNAFFGHCYDKIFSGHAAIVILALLCAYNSGVFTDILFISLFTIIYGMLLIAVRYHYTIDIVTSIIISLLLFTYKNILY